MKFFRFKQFQITDERSSMKVGTDSVLLGSWLRNANYKSVLDIGCGSGLISLLIAQRFEQAHIFAVEIDAAACLDADFNFKQSPWSDRLKVENADVRGLKVGRQYDLIISNPPFFNNSLLPDDKSKAKARHDESLLLIDLFAFVHKAISKNGVFAMVFPFDRQEELLHIAAQFDLFPHRILHTRNRPDAEIKRAFIEFGKERLSDVVFETLSIRNQDSIYSEDYKKLTSMFYLNF